MRTTLDLSDPLLRRAKKRAAEEGKSLTAVIEEALRTYLEPTAGAGKPFRLKLLTRRGRRVPAVDIADRDALYDRMDDRR